MASSTEAATSSEDSGSKSAGSSQAPTSTIGDKSGALDPGSKKWFDTFCAGFAPVLADAKSLQSSGSKMSDPAAAQKILVDLYGGLGKTFTTTGSTLKDLPAPTFQGGEAFATEVVTSFTKLGPTFTEVAKKIAAIDAKHDPAALKKAVTGTAASLTSALAPLQGMAKLKMTRETQAAVEAIPSCKKLVANG